MRTVLAFTVFAAPFVCLAGEPATSEWVHFGTNGKLVYKQTPTGDRIMDFSTAGYMGGGVPLPSVPVKRTLQPLGVPDETERIQNAINEIAAMPLEGKFRGAVLLGSGTFTCSNTIFITASGVVLRGSGCGTTGQVTTIKMAGGRHVAIATRPGAGGRERLQQEPAETNAVQTMIADAYVPSGSASFSVADANGLNAGDVIEIQKPVTDAWVRFMGMDDLTRDSKLQTWIRTGSSIAIERRIASISRNKLTLEVPLSDSLDAKHLSPPGTTV